MCVVLEIRTQRDIIAARQAGRDMACRQGFRLADQTRMATAISELTRNALQYAGGGVCTLREVSDQDYTKVYAEVEDHGPGIPDVDKAMQYGFTTSNGLGMGLPGAKSLVHEFTIQSRPGNTKVVIVIRRKK